MKSASVFEIVAARGWNVLNEGKTFTPVFVLSVFLVASFFQVDWLAFAMAVLVALPLFVMYYVYDYPLHLRWFLWLPLIGFVMLFGHWNTGLLLWAFGLYTFFTVFFWGTLYYHLRIGTTWWNFTRIWKLFLKNTDSTSGNVFEQLPKMFLQLLVLDWSYMRFLGEPTKGMLARGMAPFDDATVGLAGTHATAAHGFALIQPLLPGYIGFVAALVLYSWGIHKWLFNWKPKEYPIYTKEQIHTSSIYTAYTARMNPGDMESGQGIPDQMNIGSAYAAGSPVPGDGSNSSAKTTMTAAPLTDSEASVPPAKRVAVIVIDGCRKERFEQAETPFLSWMRQTGVYYNRMETVYPARTVVCFSSMFTGTYPAEHGIKSNMVWKLGVQVESIFDTLKAQGRKGVMYGCAHLIDAFGTYVESFTAVEKNDVVDTKIMAEAKDIMRRENPDLMVIQMIAVDQTGHSRGVWYPEYLVKIQESDALIQDFYEWMGQEGLRDDTVFVVMADHGQGDGIGGHGHLDEGERFVPFLIHGPGVRKGVTVDELRSIVSLAPTIAYLLGVPVPEKSRGPILTEALETNPAGTGAGAESTPYYEHRGDSIRAADEEIPSHNEQRTASIRDAAGMQDEDNAQDSA